MENLADCNFGNCLDTTTDLICCAVIGCVVISATAILTIGTNRPLKKDASRTGYVGGYTNSGNGYVGNLF